MIVFDWSGCMRGVSRLIGLVVAGAFIARASPAQTCLGYSSIANAGTNISGAAHFYDGGTSYGAQLNMGAMLHGHRHIISVFAQENTFDDVTVGGTTVTTDNNMTFGGSLGVQLRNSTGFEWCPQVGVDYMTGDTKVLGVQAILGVGKALSPVGAVFPVPFLWGGVRYRKPDCDSCGGDTFAAFGAGLGFRLHAGEQLTPSVSRTSESGARTAYHVSVTFPIGKKN
jgi:hypothetical protein